jgi:hypothetical protein
MPLQPRQGEAAGEVRDSRSFPQPDWTHGELI